MQNLYETFPDWLTGGGIFSKMQNPVWGTNIICANDLDLMFFTENGEKPASTFAVALSPDDDKLTRLANAVQSRFRIPWKHRFDALMQEYNPIQNYDMNETEAETRNGTSNENTNSTREDTSTDTNTQDLTTTPAGTDCVNQNTTENVDSNSGVYGFNSTAVSPSGKEDGTKNTTDNIETTTSGETKNTGTDTFTKNENSSESGSKSSTEQGKTDRTLRRSGNIGVTTTQQMLQSEIDLWMWDFFSGVFKDVCSVLTIPVYE